MIDRRVMWVITVAICKLYTFQSCYLVIWYQICQYCL